MSGECGRGVWCGQQCPARTADWDRLCRPASLAAVYTPHCTVILCLLQPPPHMSSLYTSMSVIWSQLWLASIHMLSPDVMLCGEPGVCRSVVALPLPPPSTCSCKSSYLQIRTCPFVWVFALVYRTIYWTLFIYPISNNYISILY